MSRFLVVAGTDTGVGKTVSTAAIAGVAAASGRRVAVVKPAQTGTEEGSSDVDEVRHLVGPAAGGDTGGRVSTAVLAAYPEPLAPATAARRSGRDPLRLDETVLAVQQHAAENDLVVVEGAGGLLVRFADDPPWTLLDLAGELDAAVVVVARAGLGTLNHTALTAAALRARGVQPLGVIVGAWPADPDLAERCNLDDLPRVGAGPLLGALPGGLAATSSPDGFLAAARAGLAPVLGGTFDAADFTRTNAPEPKAVK